MGTCGSCKSKEDVVSLSSHAGVSKSESGLAGFNIKHGFQKKTSKVHHHSFKGESRGTSKLLDNTQLSVESVHRSDFTSPHNDIERIETIKKVGQSSNKNQEPTSSEVDLHQTELLNLNKDQFESVVDNGETVCDQTIKKDSRQNSVHTMDQENSNMEFISGNDEEGHQITDGFTTKRFYPTQDWLDIISEKDECEHENETDNVSLVESEIIDDAVSIVNNMEINYNNGVSVKETKTCSRPTESEKVRGRNKQNKDKLNKTKTSAHAQPSRDLWEQGKVYIARGADGVLFRIRISRKSETKLQGTQKRGLYTYER